MMNISVSIPAIVNKRNQKAISNWEVMERLKAMVAPREFTHIKVTKSTLDFIRFEGEVANKPVMEDIISRVDGKHTKLSGFQEPFKIKCGPSKSNYPTKNEWNNFFRDAIDMDEVIIICLIIGLYIWFIYCLLISAVNNAHFVYLRLNLESDLTPSI